MGIWTKPSFHLLSAINLSLLLYSPCCHTASGMCVHLPSAPVPGLEGRLSGKAQQHLLRAASPTCCRAQPHAAQTGRPGLQVGQGETPPAVCQWAASSSGARHRTVPVTVPHIRAVPRVGLILISRRDMGNQETKCGYPPSAWTLDRKCTHTRRFVCDASD